MINDHPNYEFTDKNYTLKHKNYFDHSVKIIRHSGLSEIKISNRILISLYLKLYRFYLQSLKPEGLSKRLGMKERTKWFKD
jgi:hypothetical protein